MAWWGNNRAVSSDARISSYRQTVDSPAGWCAPRSATGLDRHARRCRLRAVRSVHNKRSKNNSVSIVSTDCRSSCGENDSNFSNAKNSIIVGVRKRSTGRELIIVTLTFDTLLHNCVCVCVLVCSSKRHLVIKREPTNLIRGDEWSCDGWLLIATICSFSWIRREMRSAMASMSP